jgi:hypothetical protein
MGLKRGRLQLRAAFLFDGDELRKPCKSVWRKAWTFEPASGEGLSPAAGTSGASSSVKDRTG